MSELFEIPTGQVEYTEDQTDIQFIEIWGIFRGQSYQVSELFEIPTGQVEYTEDQTDIQFIEIWGIFRGTVLPGV